MKVRVEFHRLAAKEAREAEAWYADRSPETASRFRAAVLAAAEQIAENIATHPIRRTMFRYVLVARFPYRLIYFLPDSFTARVVAVVHGRRRPEYWRSRR